MEHEVPLDRLPDGLLFPADLADRIRHDPARRRLIHRGFMSKTEYDRLYFLVEDWPYRRSLEELFRLCVDDATPPNRLARFFARLSGRGNL